MKMTQPAELLWSDKAKASGTHPRPKSLGPWPAPPVDGVQAWVRSLDEGDETPLLVIEGPTPVHRAEAYRWVFDPKLGWTAGDCGNLDTAWVQEGLVKALTQRLAFATSSDSWQLLHALLDVEDFVVTEPLRTLVDQGFRFTEFFKAIWEARHLLQEKRDQAASDLVVALTHWMTGQDLSNDERELLSKIHISRELISVQDRLDMLFFLMALAQQNGLIDRTVVVFDSFEQALRQGRDKRRDLLKEMLNILVAADRWNRLGARVGIVLGYTKAHGTLISLKGYNPKLYKRVKSASLLP